MTVRIGNMFFSDWASLPFEGGWTDTFIFRISSPACLPPYVYTPLLRRLASHTRRKRRSASLWIQVDGPGGWYAGELRRSLRGLQLPYAVTRGEWLNFLDFSFRPWLGYGPSQPPPKMELPAAPVSPEELRCLQVLGRMVKGDEGELASLTGLSLEGVQAILPALAEQKLVVHKVGETIYRGGQPVRSHDRTPLWHLTRPGLSLALRSWGVPKNVSFNSRKECNLYQIGSKHRHISRLWPAWLKAAWPQVEVWAGWCEVGIPGSSMVPDGLAWGEVQGHEALFWLEAGDEHKSRQQIAAQMRQRLQAGRRVCKTSGVDLVFVLLGPRWVRDSARRGCSRLTDDVAIVMADWKRFGELPVVEWGAVRNQGD